MGSASSTRKETKVQLRMRPLQKDVIARAAAIKQTTVTSFMLEHAFQAHFYLSPEKWDEFYAALDAPPRDSSPVRTYVAARDGRVVGFWKPWPNGSVSREEAPTRVAQGLGRYLAGPSCGGRVGERKGPRSGIAQDAVLRAHQASTS
jgi:uncharacterized protein (DUF1778 family)